MGAYGHEYWPKDQAADSDRAGFEPPIFQSLDNSLHSASRVENDLDIRAGVDFRVGLELDLTYE